MRERGARVLVTDHGDPLSRSALATVRALAAASYRPDVTVVGRWSLASLSRASEKTIRVPGDAGPAYAGAVRRAAEDAGYLTTLVSSDRALLALGAAGTEILDKAVLADLAGEAGLRVAPTTVFDSFGALVADASHLAYPVVVKPTIARYPAFRAEGSWDLRDARVDDGPVVVQPFLDEPLHAISGVVSGGRLAAMNHQRYLRIWPPRCGTASSAVTTAPDLELEARVLALVRGHEGIFQAQFAGPYLLDLNPRVYGSLPLAVAAGANLPAIYCDLLRGRERELVRSRPGVRYRWIEGDLRSLAWGVRQGSIRPAAALAALVPRRKTAHSTESVADPVPALARAWSIVAPPGRPRRG